MKVSIGHFFGKCLWLFLFFCICLNGHVVNGQTVSILGVTFMEDLSALNLIICVSSGGTPFGQINVSTEPNILTQSASEVAINVTADDLCHSHAIPIAIMSEQHGTEVTVKIAASSTTNPPVSVEESQSSFKVTIPGPTLSFGSVMYPVLEGDINDNINVILRVCQTPITVSSTADLIISGGSAVAGQDYIQPTGSITIQEQTSCTTLQIDIISDILAEEPETIIVQLQPVSPSRLSATSGTTTVTIYDGNDTITINQPPTVQCPADFSVTALPPSTSTTSLFNTPQCVDNEQANFLATCTPLSGSSINVGSNIVNCTCTDSGGLAASCTFNITVQTFILEKWYKRSLLQVPTIATEIGSTYAPAKETTSEISPSRATTTIPTTTTGMLATDTTQTMMTDVMTSTEPDLTAVMFLTDTTQTMMTDVMSTETDLTTASPTSRPDVTETAMMTGMFTTDTTQTMTPEMFTTKTTQTVTPASPTSRPGATETTKMTVMSTNTTPTMTPVDPCQTLQCDDDANCTSNEGLVKCTCKDGFYGDGTINGTGCTRCPRNVPDEKFGLNCSSPCTCASNAECDSVTGVCSGVECGDSMPTCDKNNLTVMILQDDMGVDENTAFTLNCNVNLGTADVNVTWTYPADAEIQSGIFSGNLTSNLTVSNAGKEHSGTYTCIAWLKKPTETVASRNDSININVRDFPEIDNLSLQEKSSSFLKFTWKVKDYGNDNITCRANYSEVENNKEMSQSCEETSCELSNLSPNTEYHFSVVCNNTAGPSNTLRMTSTTSSTGLVVALIVIVFIIILVVSIAVVVIFRRKSTQTDSAKRQSNKADVNYENEGLSRSTVYVNEQQTSNVDALSYEPVQNQASGGIQLDKLPRTLPDSKVESSYDYEVTGLPKQNTALPEPPVSQDLEKVIYEEMPDELNYSHALYSQEKAPVPFKVSELPEYIHQRRLGGRNALEMEFIVGYCSTVKYNFTIDSNDNRKCESQNILPW